MANGNGDRAYEDFADAARGIKSTGHHVDPDTRPVYSANAARGLHHTTPSTQTLANLTQALADEEVRYNEAVKRVAEARSVETHCINKINALQKQIDEHVAAMKQTAPRDSDWRTQARRGQA